LLASIEAVEESFAVFYSEIEEEGQIAVPEDVDTSSIFIVCFRG